MMLQTCSGRIGLFLGSGTSLAVAGPGGAVLCYVLMGIVMSSVISCLCEMTALMPVNAPVMEFPRRFLDRGVGLAVGWMYWFAWVVGAADELVAVSRLISFHYDDGKTYLDWSVGEYVDSAIWISVCLVLVISINMLPVRVIFDLCLIRVLAAYNSPQVYGELEYLIGCFKLTFITMLILLMFVLDVMKRKNFRARTISLLTITQ